MSLINQMLRDLETRQAGGEPGSPWPQGIQIVDDYVESPRGWQRWFVVVLILCALAAAAAAWYFGSSDQREAVEEADTSGGLPAVAASQAIIPTTEPQPSIVPSTLPAATNTLPPAEENATVIDSAAHAAHSRRGVDMGVQTVAQEAGATSTASSVGEAAPDLSTAETQQAVPFPTDSETPTTAHTDGDSVPAPPPAQVGNSSRGESRIPVAAAAMKPALVAKPMAYKEDRTAVAMERQQAGLPPSVREREDSVASLFRRGARALEDGYVSRAMTDLERVLTMDPRHHQASLLLLKAYASYGDYDRATALFESHPGLRADTVATRLRAQMLMKQGKTAQAEQVLEQADAPGHQESTEMVGVMAALKQRQGQHEEAAALYRRAASLQPNQAKWWLGLAISLEADEHFDAALQAYQTTYDLGAVSPQVRTYVVQRLNALRGRY